MTTIRELEQIYLQKRKKGKLNLYPHAIKQVDLVGKGESLEYNYSNVLTRGGSPVVVIVSIGAPTAALA